MTTQTVKAKIKNLSGIVNFKAFHHGDNKSFTVICKTSDAFKIAYAIHRAGWKRTSNSPNMEGNNTITFAV